MRSGILFLPCVGLFGISLTETSKLVLEPLAAAARHTYTYFFDDFADLWFVWNANANANFLAMRYETDETHARHRIKRLPA